MMRNTTYLATYKHIGVLEIIVSDQSVTVVSILGVKRFNFTRHPVNRYGILKTALRGYFTAFIENYGQREAPRVAQEQGWLLGRLIKFVTVLALETSDPDKELKRKIAKDINLFDWEDLNDFMEVESCENLIDVFHVPILVRFENFKEEILLENCKGGINERLEGRAEREIVTQSGNHRQVDSSTKVFEDFIRSEIGFYNLISKYEDKRVEEITELYRIISKNLTELISGSRIVSEADSEVDSTTKSIAVPTLNSTLESISPSVVSFEGKSLEKKSSLLKSVPPLISSSNIAGVYLKNLPGFDCCFELLNEFQKISDEHDLKIKMTNILTRVTSYAKAFGSLCEVDNTTEAMTATLKFQNLNRLLNDHADTLHLKAQSHYKKLLENEISNAMYEIIGIANCMYEENGAQYVFVLYSEHITIVEDGSKIRLLMKLENVEIIFHNRYVYLILEKTDTTLPFLYKAPDGHGILAFKSFDREATEDFCNKFYKTKYRHRRMKNYFYTMEESGIEKLFKGVIVVSSYGGEEKQLCKIADGDSRMEGIESFTYEELLRSIEEKVEMKKNRVINTGMNLRMIKVIAEHSDARRVKKAILEMYPEDGISLSKKSEILREVCQRILSLRDKGGVYGIEEMKEIVSSRIIDKKGIAEHINGFNTSYYQLIVGRADAIRRLYSTVEENVIILCMILERNLYDFFDPEDLERIILRGRAGQLERTGWDNRLTAEYFEVIMKVLNHLDKIGNEKSREKIMKVLHII